MGGGSSVPAKKVVVEEGELTYIANRSNVPDLLLLAQTAEIQQQFEDMKPVYFVPNLGVPKPESRDIAYSVWELIIQEEVQVFNFDPVRRQPNPPTCVEWFCRKFYTLLHQVDPICEMVYPSDVNVQVLIVKHMIEVILGLFKVSEDNGPTKIQNTLSSIAVSHFRKGILSHQYPLMGSVLIAAFKKCLGVQFSDQMEMAWCDIFSAVLYGILPISLPLDSKASPDTPAASTANTANATAGSRMPLPVFIAGKKSCPIDNAETPSQFMMSIQNYDD